MLLAKLALVLAVLAGLLVWLAPRFERALLYVPDTRRISPASAGLAGVDEIVLRASDGVEVLAWWARARPGQPTILYFHGNGGALAGRAERIAAYQSLGRGIFMMTYRGYGGSGGQPSERANVSDAIRALDWLSSAEVPPDRIIVYGESLGSGIAVQVAAARPVAGLILDAPYTSIADVGALHYPWLPVRLMMRDRYETLQFVGNITAPLLIIHGDQDEVIPIDMARTVLDAAPYPKRLAIIAGAGHNDHYLFGSFEIVQDWIEALRARKSNM